MTSEPTDIADQLHALSDETLRSFEWLANGLDPSQTVTFVPNPGNIGDAAINLACFRFLRGRFDRVKICAPSERPDTEYVFVGGGGNLVEPLYRRVGDFLWSLPVDRQILIFPVTIVGFADLLRHIGTRARIICRETVSYESVQRHMSGANVVLGHDAAFTLVDLLHDRFAGMVARHNPLEARLYRTDREKAIAADGDFDMMAQSGSEWEDIAAAERLLMVVAKYIAGFGRIHTDRLHCAILAAMLERDTILKPNSYFKNEAVFRHSLSRLPNVKFDPSEPRISPEGGMASSPLS